MKTLATTEDATIVFKREAGGKIRAISRSFKDDGVQIALPRQSFEVRYKEGRLLVVRKSPDPVGIESTLSRWMARAVMREARKFTAGDERRIASSQYTSAPAWKFRPLPVITAARNGLRPSSSKASSSEAIKSPL